MGRMWSVRGVVFSMSLLGGIGLLAGGMAMAADPTHADLGACVSIKSDGERLSCYDAIAKGAAPPAADPAKAGSAWEVEITKSPIDDSTNVFLTTVSEESFPGRFGGARQEAFLMVRCMEKATASYVIWGDTFIGVDSTMMQHRIDDEKAKTETVSISTDHKATGHWSGGRAIPFIKTMFGKKKMLVRVTPHSESPVTVTFDISGLEQVIKPLRQSCKW